MQSEYRIVWQKANDKKAKLLRIYGTSPQVTIPKTVKGHTIVEIAPYCFCQTNKLEYEDIQEELIGDGIGLQEICGNALEEIYLPDTIEKIGSYAFYNCKKLRKIELGANTEEIGSDAFMNTIALHQLTFRCSPAEKSGIKQILARFSSDIEVTFQGQKGKEAVLLYPEYYESYDEIAPAHLFGRNIEGEGFRARQYIQDGIVDFRGYDGIFAQACVDEPEKKLVRMALNRLQYPYALSENHRQMYKEYLKEHILPQYTYEITSEAAPSLSKYAKKSFIHQLIEERQLDTLHFLCQEKILEGAKFTTVIQLAAEAEWAEGTAELLQFKSKQADKKSRYSFDEF